MERSAIWDKWASWFRKWCSHCLPAQSSSPRREPRCSFPVSRQVTELRHSGTKAIKMATDISYASSSASLEAGIKMQGVRSVGVRLTRTGPHAARVMRTIPELQTIVGRELRRENIDDLWTCPRITAKLLDPATLAASKEGFIRWCRSDEAPAMVHRFDQDRLAVLYWAALALDASAKNLESQLEEGAEYAFPYFQLDAYACRIPKHASIDGFIAKRDDPIWEIIWPPNGWLCACTVQPLLEMDVEDVTVASQPGISRLESAIWVDYSQWYTRSPLNTINPYSERIRDN